MDTREQENRVVALGHAVSDRLALDVKETAEEVVEAAEKYFEFLQGKKDD